jgi:polysaccharide biosynthesis transport protein
MAASTLLEQSSSVVEQVAPQAAQEEVSRTVSAGETSGVISPLVSIRNHRRLAVRAALIVLFLGAPAVWFFGRPQYVASASVYVSPVFQANLQANREVEQKSNYEYREYVLQNVRTIDRFDILTDALRNLGHRVGLWTRPGETELHAAERLQRALKIEAVPDTYQITVSLEGKHPNGLAEIVNSVVNTYLSRAKSEEFYASDERVKNLIADRERLQKEVELKRARRVAISQELGIGTFSENYVNPYDQLLVDAKEALQEANTTDISAQAHLNALDGKQRNGGADALQAAALELASKDLSLTSLLADQNLRRTQLLTSINGLSSDHPGRRAAERELASLDKARQDAYQRLVGSYSTMLLQQRKAEAYRTAQVKRKLEGEVAQQASRASWFSSNYQEGIQVGNDLDSLRKRVDALQERIDSIALERRAPGFVRMFSSARTPDQPAKDRGLKLLLLLIAASLAIAMMAPVLADALDPRVHSPRDVESMLGFAPLAWMLESQDDGQDFAREQTFRLANRMSQEQQTHGSSVFAFTSVKAKGGVSTLARETARALTRLGVPTLVVEANAYRADPRYRSPDSRGLNIVLQNLQPLESAIVPGDAQMPDYVPVGDLQSEQSLPDLHNLRDVLRQATESYNIVLVDIPPLLVSADAEFIARGCDVVMLVVEAERTTKAELQRAAKSLERLQVRAVSAFLNRVDPNAANGFGLRAFNEFKTGVTETEPVWLSPWLWR